MITIEDFKKLNIVVGTIENVEEIEGSEKLYKFTINIGTETRQVLGGLKPSYQPSELLGKQVIVLGNLEPRQLMGFESQGMILCASDESDKPVIITPEKPVANGSIIR
ncbi:MAG: methionine--tRNA ligase [Candidatus Yanofskybacteria bacterium]|nr:methionine--tRNA ligase [Candidatus Yanofskybacteria bacterium]